MKGLVWLFYKNNAPQTHNVLPNEIIGCLIQTMKFKSGTESSSSLVTALFRSSKFFLLFSTSSEWQIFTKETMCTTERVDIWGKWPWRYWTPRNYFSSEISHYVGQWTCGCPLEQQPQRDGLFWVKKVISLASKSASAPGDSVQTYGFLDFYAMTFCSPSTMIEKKLMLPFNIKLLTWENVQRGLTGSERRFQVEGNRKATIDLSLSLFPPLPLLMCLFLCYTLGKIHPSTSLLSVCHQLLLRVSCIWSSI